MSRWQGRNGFLWSEADDCLAGGSARRVGTPKQRGGLVVGHQTCDFPISAAPTVSRTPSCWSSNSRFSNFSPPAPPSRGCWSSQLRFSNFRGAESLRPHRGASVDGIGAVTIGRDGRDRRRAGFQRAKGRKRTSARRIIPRRGRFSRARMGHLATESQDATRYSFYARYARAPSRGEQVRRLNEAAPLPCPTPFLAASHLLNPASMAESLTRSIPGTAIPGRCSRSATNAALNNHEVRTAPAADGSARHWPRRRRRSAAARGPTSASASAGSRDSSGGRP